MPQLFEKPEPRTLAAAAAWVAVGFALRLLLMPVLGGNHAYSVFYPIILFLAFRHGRVPAALAAGLSGILAFWAFVTPQFSLKLDGSSLAALGLFGLNACVGIYLISSLTDAVRKLSDDQSRLNDQVATHASLFVELQARISHHLQLVVGILAYQAKGEPDDELAIALTRAGQRSELIADAHRQLSGLGGDDLEFVGFARAVAAATAARVGRAVDEVEVSGVELELSPQRAISLGVALMECLSRLLNGAPEGKISVEVVRTAEDVRLYVAHSTFQGGEILLAAPSSYLFKAMVEQLGAKIVPSHSRDHGARLAICLSDSSPKAPYSTVH